MPDVITESGMDFVADNVFHIEKSNIYVGLGIGVKSVEFVRAIGNTLIFIEAKTSFPKPDDNPSTDDKERFRNSINEVCEKFIHSLNLYSSVKVGATENELSGDFKPEERVEIQFVLVVKNHAWEWCRDIKTAIEVDLPIYLNRIWKPTVFVINHKAAIKHNLAIA